MKVLKFGGTSVGSAERMKSVAELIDNGESKIIVLSAMSGTTNSLVKISKCLFNEDPSGASLEIDTLEKKYYEEVGKLYTTEEYRQKGKAIVNVRFREIRALTDDLFSVRKENILLIQGELLSTSLFYYYLSEAGINSVLLQALNFMRINKQDDPDEIFLRENLKRELSNYPDVTIFITQGFICRNAYGEIDNLKRGGGDYSASLIGSALVLDEIQIWTDIDGVHNNDPRFVENTKRIDKLSFDEAAELAYFGAKILHPSSILPAKLTNVPVRLKNTLLPQAEGTIISSVSSGGGIKAVAAKDGITAIKIKSGRMLLAYGFLRKVFEIFETYKTSIDMITTSEIAVSVTIDDMSNIENIIRELSEIASVEVDKQQSIICVVGDFIAADRGIAIKVFEALKKVPIRMISYGGSNHNISLLVNTTDKKEALTSLSNYFFD